MLSISRLYVSVQYLLRPHRTIGTLELSGESPREKSLRIARDAKQSIQRHIVVGVWEVPVGRSVKWEAVYPMKGFAVGYPV